MPYIYNLAREAHETGISVLRPMALEFNHDRVCDHLETQYMFGDRLLVAPIFSSSGEVDVYLPQGTWTSLLTNEVKTGGYYHEKHGYMSLPLYVRENTLLARGAVNDRPDYDYAKGTKFELFALQDGAEACAQITNTEGQLVYTLKAVRCGNTIAFVGKHHGAALAEGISVLLRNVDVAHAANAEVTKTDLGVLIKPQDVTNFTVEL